MNSTEDLKNWFIKMGYQEKLPADLSVICNATTAFLWIDVMDKVKPRSEIARIRNTLLLKHIATNTKAQEDTKHKIKEILVWARRRHLETQVAFVEEQTRQKKEEIASLERKNKMKYLTVENIRRKIWQHREYAYLLDVKSKDMEGQLQFVEGMLNANLMPMYLENEYENRVFDYVNRFVAQLQKSLEIDKSTCNSFSSSHSRNSSELLDEMSFDFSNVSTSSPITLKVNTEDTLHKKLSEAEGSLNSTVEQLLYENSRKCVWRCLNKSNELAKQGLLQVVNRPKISLDCQHRKEETSLATLYAKHVNYELKAVELKINIKNLKMEKQHLEIGISKEIHKTYPTCLSDVESVVALKQKELSLRVASRHLSDTVNRMREETDDMYNLPIVRMKLKQLNEDIGFTTKSIRQTYDFVQRLLERMLEMCNDHSCQMTKLHRFVGVDWTNPLLVDVVVDEINTFLEYPLDRKDCDVNLFNAWSPFEVLLINLAKAKVKLHILTSLQTIQNEYAYEEVQSESGVTQIIKKINSMICSSTSTEQRLKAMKELIDLWLEMPIKAYLSSKRNVGGSNYQHYERVFEEFYKCIF